MWQCVKWECDSILFMRVATPVLAPTMLDAPYNTELYNPLIVDLTQGILNAIETLFKYIYTLFRFNIFNLIKSCQ